MKQSEIYGQNADSCALELEDLQARLKKLRADAHKLSILSGQVVRLRHIEALRSEVGRAVAAKSD